MNADLLVSILKHKAIELRLRSKIEPKTSLEICRPQIP